MLGYTPPAFRGRSEDFLLNGVFHNGVFHAMMSANGSGANLEERTGLLRPS